MSYNNDQNFNIKTIYGTILTRVDDFKYLGAWVDSSEKDGFNFWKALTVRESRIPK